MATSYPGSITDNNSQERIGGTIMFTDDTDQPGSVLPAIVDASNLPTSDPGVAGQLYSDSGVLTASAG